MFEKIIFNIDCSFKVVDIFVNKNDLIKNEINLMILENDHFYVDCFSCFFGIVKKIIVNVGDTIKNGDILIFVDLKNEGEFYKSSFGNLLKSSNNKINNNFKISRKIFLPDLGFKNSEVTDIFVKEKNFVKNGDTLIVIENDKVSVEIPSICSGIVRNILVKIGDFISSGNILLTLYVDSFDLIILKNSNKKLISDKKKSNNLEKQKKLKTTKNKKKDLIFNYAPSVKRLADQFSVNLNFICGTGLKKRIVRSDVINYIKNCVLNYKNINNNLNVNNNDKIYDINNDDDVSYVNLNNIKKKIIVNLSKSWSNIPHVTQFGEIDISNLNKFRKIVNLKLLNECSKFKLTLLIFVIKTLSKILIEMPIFNSSVSDNLKNIILRKYINIGIVVNTSLGLFIPVIYDVKKKSILELAEELNYIKIMLRSGKYDSCNFKKNSFTISNLGYYVSGKFTPIINRNESAILGLSKSYLKPVWNSNLSIFEPKLYLPLSLSYDHRIINGVDAAKFINLLVYYLSNISNLLL